YFAVATEMLRRIASLYIIQNDGRSHSADQRHTIPRQAASQSPDALPCYPDTWNDVVNAKSKSGEAFGYAPSLGMACLTSSPMAASTSTATSSSVRSIPSLSTERMLCSLVSTKAATTA